MTRVAGAWLEAEGTQAVMKMLEASGHSAYAVGGCVRNALLNVPVRDVDISTDARPERVMALADAAEMKAVPTGIEHGTVTVVTHGTGYEITTFRADIETDGRRAVVRFADSMAEDAIRRDFTMNALYADRFGVVHDPLNGLPDLQARRVRFIEDAARRIEEDYLRILRFFRFSAWYGDPQNGMDADALAGIAGHLDGLDGLSAERVGAEITRLLTAPDPVMAVAVMEQAGVLARVLPGTVSRALGPLVQHEISLDLAPQPLRRLAVLGMFDGARLRLSRPAIRQLETYQRLIGADTGLAEIAWRDDAALALDVAALRAASFEAPLPHDLTEQVSKGAAAQFPVTAADLMPELEGAALGQALRELERRWIASDFRLGKTALLKGLQQG